MTSFGRGGWKTWVGLLVALPALGLIGCKPKTPPDRVNDSKKTKPCETFDSASTPVKGCCGSMSFHSTGDWKPVTSSKGAGYCTNIPKASKYVVFVGESSKPLSDLTGPWTVTVHSYIPKKGYHPGEEGVQLTANPEVGCNKEVNSMALTITPLHPRKPISGSAGFYDEGGPTSSGYANSVRFRDDAQYADYDCSKDRDKCERIASVHVGKESQPCKDANCTIYIMNPDLCAKP